MKIEDLPSFDYGGVFGTDDPERVVRISDLPVSHDAKTDPPKHGGTVLVGWDDSEWYGLGRWNPGGEVVKARFVTPTGVTFPKQPDWWCELLIPPPSPQEAKP